MVFYASSLDVITLPASLEVIDRFCFLRCESLYFVTVAVEYKLSRVEKLTCYGNGLQAMKSPASLEVICEQCFFNCRSVT
jgi:hypothetical protein